MAKPQEKPAVAPKAPAAPVAQAPAAPVAEAPKVEGKVLKKNMTAQYRQGDVVPQKFLDDAKARGINLSEFFD